MPITSFDYEATLTGSDLPFIPEPLRASTEIKFHRNVSLAWGTTPGTTTSRDGRSGDSCWRIDTTAYTITWTATITESGTRHRQPAPGINKVGSGISTLGGIIVGVGAATAIYTWWTGAGAVGGAAIAGAGAVVVGAGELIKWLTEAEDKPFTTTTVESGEKAFEHSTYTHFDCKPNVDYPDVTIPRPIKSYEAAESEAVQQVGVEISHRPGVNLGQ